MKNFHMRKWIFAIIPIILFFDIFHLDEENSLQIDQSLSITVSPHLFHTESQLKTFHHVFGWISHRRYVHTQHRHRLSYGRSNKLSLEERNSPMRYHSPFMMKSDKSPPFSEFSTRSSYQDQSSIKTGTYLRLWGVPLRKQKAGMHAHAAAQYLSLPLVSRNAVATSTATQITKRCIGKRYLIQIVQEGESRNYRVSWGLFRMRLRCTEDKADQSRLTDAAWNFSIHGQ